MGQDYHHKFLSISLCLWIYGEVLVSFNQRGTLYGETWGGWECSFSNKCFNVFNIKRLVFHCYTFTSVWGYASSFFSHATPPFIFWSRYCFSLINIGNVMLAGGTDATIEWTRIYGKWDIEVLEFQQLGTVVPFVDTSLRKGKTDRGPVPMISTYNKSWRAGWFQCLPLDAAPVALTSLWSVATTNLIVGVWLLISMYCTWRIDTNCLCLLSETDFWWVNTKQHVWRENARATAERAVWTKRCRCSCAVVQLLDEKTDPNFFSRWEGPLGHCPSYCSVWYLVTGVILLLHSCSIADHDPIDASVLEKLQISCGHSCQKWSLCQWILHSKYGCWWIEHSVVGSRVAKFERWIGMISLSS